MPGLVKNFAAVFSLVTSVLASPAALAITVPPTPPTCFGDVTRNGVVNVDDLLAVINGWGACPNLPTPCPADIAPTAGNRNVNVDDLLVVLNSWGPCPNDVAVIAIDYLSPAISTTNVPTTVALKNYGATSVDSTVTVCINGFCGNPTAYHLNPFEVRLVTCAVTAPTPGSLLNCGAVGYYPISACSSFFDGNSANNCKSGSIGLVKPFYDLGINIISGDDIVHVGHSFSWTVQVTNYGNSPSQNVCYATGVNCQPGPNNWGPPCTLMAFNGSTGIIQPGETKSVGTWSWGPVTSPPVILYNLQYLKAELYDFGNCADICGQGSGNNFHQETIRFLP